MQNITTTILFLYLCCLKCQYCRTSSKYTWNYQFEKRLLTNFKASSSSFCPAGTILWSNVTTLNGIDFLNFWYPWLHLVFPRCWEAIKPLLCFKVKENLIYSKPCRNICHRAVSSCWMLKQFMPKHKFELQLNSGTQDLFDCNGYDEKVCNANFTYTKTATACNFPLHDADYSNQDIKIVSRYVTKSLEESISGCSLLCDSALHVHKAYDKDIKLPVLILFCIGCFVSIFTICTFLVDWKCQRRYPAVILFILNSLFLLCLIGWLIQFFGVGNSIRCSPNNFRRLEEPSYDKPFWCLMSFILIYFSSIAIACWFVILTYSWYISFKALGTTKNCIHGKIKYFHLIAWSISVLLTMLVIFLGEVDSHEFTNICFLGYRSETTSILFVYIPYMTSLIFGECFIVCSTKVLKQLHAECSLFLVPRAAKNIIRTIRRFIIYGLIMIIVVTMPIICAIFEFIQKDSWSKDFEHYVKCNIVQSAVHVHPFYPKECVQPENKKLLCFHIELLCLFIACIATNSWTWTSATGRIWLKQWKKMTTHYAHQQLQISWYARMQKKKITPFVPPIDLANPLESNLSRRHSENYGIGMIYPYPNNQTAHNTNVQRRKNSEDIRSVFELFSARRCTKASLESLEDQSLHLPGFNKRSNSLSSVPNYGHLAYGNVNQDGNLFRKMSSNITLMQLKNNMENGRCSSNLTLTHLKNVRDSVFTPISLAHKDNIVADCIPYTSMQVGPFPDKVRNQSVNQSLCWDQGMEPYSISSADEVVNL